LAPDLFVVGNAISRGNPLLEAILERNLAYVSGPQWLAQNILQGRWVLGVAGTHGKTTTTSLLTWILEEAGLNPSFLVGGVPQGFGVSARLTDSPFFVIEADEYDTAFCDKRSKFVHYQPRTAILNNLEFDHADIFADLAAIETQFHHLVRTLPGNGPDCRQCRRNVAWRGYWHGVAGLRSNGSTARQGWQAGSRMPRAVSRFRWPAGFWAGSSSSPCRRPITAPTRWQPWRPRATLGCRWRSGSRPWQVSRGVRRRLEIRGEVRGVTVIDDFAHHPTAIRVTIAKACASGSASTDPRGAGAALQHHEAWVMKAQLPAAWPTPMRPTAMPPIWAGMPPRRWRRLGPKARSASMILASLVQRYAPMRASGDQILVMSNGGFGGVHEKLACRPWLPEPGNAGKKKARGTPRAF
jgi:UDP-N-acetylmuramate: L-alanyl-gamma-D-glutamyl-meso-diaminopimelate ligase